MKKALESKIRFELGIIVEACHQGPLRIIMTFQNGLNPTMRMINRLLILVNIRSHLI